MRIEKLTVSSVVPSAFSSLNEVIYREKKEKRKNDSRKAKENTERGR